MYLDFYDLKQSPFSITATSSCFYQSNLHEEALANIQYGINNRKGIMLLTGEVGTGKTTVSKVLMSRLPVEYKSSLILNPYFNANQLIRAILEDFGIAPAKKNKLDMVNTLNDFLLKTYSQNSVAVVIIDEAQDLGAAQLEQIRLLSNLETDYAKLLQIVLVGQPELREKLSQYKLRQIKQRISIQFDIKPLTKNELVQYIEFRISQENGRAKFTDRAYNLIYAFTGGIPRLTNILCDRALLAGFANEILCIDEDIIESCIQEIK